MTILDRVMRRPGKSWIPTFFCVDTGKTFMFIIHYDHYNYHKEEGSLLVLQEIVRIFVSSVSLKPTCRFSFDSAY